MGALQKSILYLKFSVKTFLKYPGLKTIWEPVKYFSPWIRSMSPGRNSVVDKRPWITFPSIAFLENILRPDMTIFEYGSGGSTLYWISHVKKVISVEHDREWYHLLKSEFEKKGISNVDYRLTEAVPDDAFDKKDFANPDHYISSDENYKGRNFENYVKQIDQFPDSYFDIIMVDGRARPSCIAHATAKIKNGGYIIIDNSDREYYFEKTNFKNGNWKRIDFPGPIPYTYNFSKTSLIQKIK
ncbi:MAG: hypothetical protein C5B52_15490 [Bacteroidetes bacterium]|nr:MAG: hypothetical protein C5B52_15490 [Bacteroidota bacterium]